MRHSRITLMLGASWALAACAANQRPTTVESGGDVTTNVITPVDNNTIPAGAQLTATLDQTLGTNVSQQMSAAIAGQKPVAAALSQSQLYAQDVGDSYK